MEECPYEVRSYTKMLFAPPIRHPHPLLEYLEVLWVGHTVDLRVEYSPYTQQVIPMKVALLVQVVHLEESSEALRALKSPHSRVPGSSGRVLLTLCPTIQGRKRPLAGSW